MEVNPQDAINSPGWYGNANQLRLVYLPPGVLACSCTRRPRRSLLYYRGAQV